MQNFVFKIKSNISAHTISTNPGLVTHTSYISITFAAWGFIN